MKQLLNFILPALLILSCSKKGGAGDSPDNVRGMVSGRITDASGNPLAGVTVYAGHDTYYNTNVIGVSNNNGIYTLDLRGQPGGTWSIHADVVKDYNGRSYRFRVDPANTAPLTTTEGGVRDLTWALKGVIPGSTDDSRLGGYVTFIQSGYEYVPIEELQFKLEPIGTLVDGTQGVTIVRMAEVFPYNLTGLYNREGLRDIPVGRYKVSVTHKPAAGPAVAVRIAAKGSDSYSTSLTADFKQDAAYTFQEMELNIKID